MEAEWRDGEPTNLLAAAMDAMMWLDKFRINGGDVRNRARFERCKDCLRKQIEMEEKRCATR